MTQAPDQPPGDVAVVSDADLTASALSASAVRQVVGLYQWVGAGRRLTQTGQLTMADARHLVGLLGTGDEIDPAIGERVLRTRSSKDLRGLATVLAWAKAAGLVRVVHGRLVPVKKNARLVDRPLELWTAMFEAVPGLGEAICTSGWYTSLVGHDFPGAVATLLASIARGSGAIQIEDANEAVWSTLTARYRMDDATIEQLRHWRKDCDRDLRHAIDKLIELGVLAEDRPGTVALTALADWTLRRRFGVVAAGDRLAQVTVTLRDTDPPVWRQLLVPAAIRLDRLHLVIHAAMGWTNSHLHMFIHPTGRYGTPDEELPLRDERQATLRDLAVHPGNSFGYEYDFGDSWEHDILLEQVTPAEPDGQYPACVAGERACPPEDCGGTPGYAELIHTLADPGHPDHQEMLQWLGLDKASDFDPAHFDTTDANRRIDATVLGALGST